MSAAAADMGFWEAVDAYQGAVDAATAAELLGDGSSAFYLHLAALETAVARRAAVYAVISIHRALLAGAAVRQIADVTGLSADQVAARWTEWADGQVRLRERAGSGMTREEYERAAAAVIAGGGPVPDAAGAADRPGLPGMRM